MARRAEACVRTLTPEPGVSVDCRLPARFLALPVRACTLRQIPQLVARALRLAPRSPHIHLNRRARRQRQAHGLADSPKL